VLSEFSKRALSGSLGAKYPKSPALAVVGNTVFVCRQLYTTCEGLQIIYQYGLHTTIANAWKVVSRDDSLKTATLQDSNMRHAPFFLVGTYGRLIGRWPSAGVVGRALSCKPLGC